MQYVEEITGNNFAILRDLLLVKIALEGYDELVAVLLDHESNQLLRNV
jgi:hypothetical protein